jgi:4-hydroxybenzoate polyprenyltransferase
MMINVVIAVLVFAIVVSGSFLAWLFRREPWKAVNIAALTLGLCLLTYGHLQWAVRRESPEIKQAMFIRHLVAGWAMVGMGFVGLQSGSKSPKGDE